MPCQSPQKRRWKTREEALGARAEMVQRGVDTGRYLRVYACMRHWHIGHSGKLWGAAIRRATRAGTRAFASAGRPRKR